jgi:hypothetical protein
MLVVGLVAYDFCAPFLNASRNYVALSVGELGGNDFREVEHPRCPGTKLDREIVMPASESNAEDEVLRFICRVP